MSIQLSKILKEIELEKFESLNRAGKVFPFETDYRFQLFLCFLGSLYFE